MRQEILDGWNSHEEISKILRRLGSKKFLLVCDGAFQHIPFKRHFDEIDIPYVKFDDIVPNPTYEIVCKAVDLFSLAQCDAIIAVGGGSTIDVAKCVKLFSPMDKARNYLGQEYRGTAVPLIAMPTTAGTGSESTRHAVIYYKGEKQSISHDSILPDYAILDYNVLHTLPPYQKICTMLDALCQGIESWWSIKSTGESREYSKTAVRMIMDHMQAYIGRSEAEAAKAVMLGANYAGRAINITQTTAAHAMSYKITSLYGLPHGHAVAVCLPKVWRHMAENTDMCIDERGKGYLEEILRDIAHAMGADSSDAAIGIFERMLGDLHINNPETGQAGDLHTLAASVNPDRLKNNPVYISEDLLYRMYREIVTVK